MIVHRKLKTFGRDSMDVYRCLTCEAVVVGSQRSLGQHAGHRLKSPCKISVLDYIKITLGIIR